MSDEMRYTVASFLLADCPLEYLQREAAAGNALRTGGYVSADDWAKLRAVEAEIARRAPTPTPDPRDAVVAAARVLFHAHYHDSPEAEGRAWATLRDALKGLGR